MKNFHQPIDGTNLYLKHVLFYQTSQVYKSLTNLSAVAYFI